MSGATVVVQFWNSQALPASGTVNGQTFSLANKYGYGFQVEYSSGLTGTFQVQISNDKGVVNPDGTISYVTNWTSVTGESAAVSGSAGNAFFDTPSTSAAFVRLIYIATSGTGTASANATLKAA